MNKPREFWVGGCHHYRSEEECIEALNNQGLDDMPALVLVDYYVYAELQRDNELILKANELFAEENLKLIEEIKELKSIRQKEFHENTCLKSMGCHCKVLK